MAPRSVAGLAERKTRRRSAMMKAFSLAVVLPLLILPSLPLSTSFAQVSASSPIKHVIVIVEENHTFDNYFGTYHGANGLSSAMAQPVARNSTNLVRPFMINTTTVGGNPCETWECAHQAYDSGKMDGFVAANRGSNLTMGYFNPKLIPYYWDYASQFVLLDNFYTSVMTNSLPNHLYMVAGQSGGLTHDARAGIMNFTSSNVHDNGFFFKSIVDELEANHVSWRYYAGGNSYLNNWNPLPAFASFVGDKSRINNVVPTEQFASDVTNGTFPSVSWVMPATDQESEHPPYDISLGQRDVVSAINAVMKSSYWNSSAIFLTWDDWGGWYDHVPPPQVDQFGYGFRVPCLIISPYAKQGHIDHAQGDFTSFLKLIENIFSLPPLTSRDGSANSLVEAFDFSQPPRAPLVLPGSFKPDQYPLTYPNGTAFGNSRPSSQTGSTTTTSATVTKTITTTSTETFTAKSPTNTSTGSPDSLTLALLVALGVVTAALIAMPIWIWKTRRN